MKTSTPVSASVKKQGAVTVVRPGSALTRGEPIVQLQNAVPPALRHGRPLVVVDLTDTLLLDSAGLDYLIELDQLCADRGGILRLCDVGELCSDILRITGVSQRLEICDDLTDALGSFS